VLRAVFVPDGEDLPAEFMSDFDPLHFRVTRDPVTGALTGATAGTDFDGDIRAEWHPDAEEDGAEMGGDGAAGSNVKSGDDRHDASIPPSNARPTPGSPGRPRYLDGAVGRTSRSGVFTQAANGAGVTGSNRSPAPGAGGSVDQLGTSIPAKDTEGVGQTGSVPAQARASTTADQGSRFSFRAAKPFPIRNLQPGI
jgi:hypothetical protein